MSARRKQSHPRPHPQPTVGDACVRQCPACDRCLPLGALDTCSFCELDPTVRALANPDHDQFNRAFVDARCEAAGVHEVGLCAYCGRDTPRQSVYVICGAHTLDFCSALHLLMHTRYMVNHMDAIEVAKGSSPPPPSPAVQALQE